MVVAPGGKEDLSAETNVGPITRLNQRDGAGGSVRDPTRDMRDVRPVRALCEARESLLAGAPS
jgi:hypothetical protein